MMINNVNLGNAVHNGDTVDTVFFLIFRPYLLFINKLFKT